MPKQKESLEEMRIREMRYDAARAEWDQAIKEGRKPSHWCVEETWATCLGPAKPQKPK